MLAAQVLPPAVLVFPFLTMAYALRLNDTLVPVIFAHLSFVLPRGDVVPDRVLRGSSPVA